MKVDDSLVQALLEAKKRLKDPNLTEEQRVKLSKSIFDLESGLKHVVKGHIDRDTTRNVKSGNSAKQPAHIPQKKG